MIAKYHGRNYSLQKIRALCDISRDGVSLLSISDAAEKIGFRCRGVKRGLEQLKNVELPCILHWAQNHFVVLYRIKNKKFTIGDPSLGIINYSEAEFVRSWASDVTNKIGVVLLLAPTNIFHELAEEEGEQVKWKSILRHVVSYKKLFIQLLFGLLTGSIIQLITPFLTQSIVDVGISTRNINFIVVILIAQATLIIGRISLEYMRSWILLHISTRISVSILTEFLIKLMRLPISFFDTKQTGDIMQRMNDQRNIEVFLTGSALTSMFSILNLLIFSIVLVYYNVQIFLVFLIFSTLYMGWIMFFLKNRRLLNNKSFEISAKNQSSMVQLISGMQEIKLNNCEKQKRWDWENIQAMLFNFNLKSLQLNQYQHGGASLINEFKNLLITFLSVKAVISGELTFGGMVALQFIIGQLNGPLDQIITFVQSFQDAKISLERLNEIHALPDEQQVNKDVKNCLPRDKSLFISDLTFSYPGSGNYSVLTGINLVIPEGKTTAIVGMSGSGKTTILKLLLRFYDPQVGEINVGNTSIRDISYKVWRD
jgi:ATP-binding cassette subfamily B protein